MTNPYQDAAKDLARFANMLSGIIALGPELERVGSLPQAAQEAQNHLDKINAEVKEHQTVDKSPLRTRRPMPLRRRKSAMLARRPTKR
jgi:hypothetical protein